MLRVWTSKGLAGGRVSASAIMRSCSAGGRARLGGAEIGAGDPAPGGGLDSGIGVDGLDCAPVDVGSPRCGAVGIRLSVFSGVWA